MIAGTQLTRTWTKVVVDAATLAAMLQPRAGVVGEQLTETAGPSVCFDQYEGPLAAYRRTVTVAPSDQDPDHSVVTQEVMFRVGVPFVSWLFVLPLRSYLGRVLPRDKMPWWAPPGRLNRRAATGLARLCALTVLVGYLSDLLPDTMTYAAREFGVGKTGQGLALGIVQVNAVLALVLLARADRKGRRQLLVTTAAVGAIFTALGAAAPSLTILAATQVVAGALLTAIYIVIAIIAVEEMPPGSRAWGLGLISMCFGLGAGIALAALPLADTGRGGWRWLFALGLVTIPGFVGAARQLPESHRYRAHSRANAPGDLTGLHRDRLVLLGAAALLLALFATPAGQFQNEFLRTERHLSAIRISLLQQVAGTIGGLGTLVGGRLADTHGRRPVAAAGVGIGAAVTLAVFFSRGAGLWLLSIASSLLSYGVGPALSVYGAELFPTSSRGRAGGILTILAAAGGILGLVAAGLLSGAIGTIGPALAILAVGPLAVVYLIARRYPETAGHELEDLNPEDVIGR